MRSAPSPLCLYSALGLSCAHHQTVTQRTDKPHTQRVPTKRWVCSETVKLYTLTSAMIHHCELGCRRNLRVRFGQSDRSLHRFPCRVRVYCKLCTVQHAATATRTYTHSPRTWGATPPHLPCLNVQSTLCALCPKDPVGVEGTPRISSWFSSNTAGLATLRKSYDVRI